MEIHEAQKKIDTWIKTVGVRYFDELTNLAILMEEVGELSRIFSRKYGEQSFKHSMSDIEIDNKVEEELADILFVVMCIANQTNVDLESALNKSLDKKTNRDRNRHKTNPKLK